VKRKTAAVFEVKRRETVTITVTPISVGAFVAAAHDGDPLVDQSPTKKHFEYIFTITEPVDSAEVVKIIAQFMGSESSTARYEIAVGSDDGGQTYSIVSIEKPDSTGLSERSRMIRFEVVQ
jgi:hypothetical protein